MRKTLTLAKMEREKQGRQIPAVIKWVVVSGCVAADFTTFYILFDQMFTQAEILNWLVAAVSAIAINMFPMLISLFLNNRGLSNFERAAAAVFGLAFVAALSICFIIRLASRDALFGMGDTLLRSSSVVEIAGKTTYTVAQTATAVLMGIMPMLTSLICFGLTYKNPDREYMQKLRRQQINLREKMNGIEVNIALLDEELCNQDLDGFDTERFGQAVKTVELIRQYCQIVARRVLAQKLGTALAAAALMEENSLKSIISETVYNNNTLQERR